MARRVGDVTIECVVGDIAGQPDATAIVNAASAGLRLGGGVAGAVHMAAGPELEAECRALAPIRPGQAVITGGHALPNADVIHCLGPVHGVDRPGDELLAACCRNALDLPERPEIDSIAFPAIAAGAFGFPMQSAAHIAMHAVLRQAPRLKHVRFVRFVLTDDRSRSLHEHALTDAAANLSAT